MTVPLALGVRQTRILATRDYIDSNGGGRILLYTGSPPSIPDAGTSETLLCTILFGVAPSANLSVVSTKARLTYVVPQIAVASSTGIVAWGRFANGLGYGVMDLPVGAPGSGMPIILSDTQLYAGGEVQLLSCILEE